MFNMWQPKALATKTSAQTSPVDYSAPYGENPQTQIGSPAQYQDSVGRDVEVEGTATIQQCSTTSFATETGTFWFVPNKEALYVAGDGSPVEWVNTIECLIWLEQVIGSPKIGFAYRPWNAEITDLTSLTLTNLPPELSSMNLSKYVKIAFEAEVFIDRKNPPFDTCWSRLIESAYIAQRRVPEILNKTYGIRIPFGIMTELAAIERRIKLNNSGTILAGYDTALIPIRIAEGGKSIVWHALFDEKLSGGGAVTNIEMAMRSEMFTPLDIEMPLPEAVGYLGWSENV
jgi:hypothetical protein